MEENGNMEKTLETVSQGDVFLEELRTLVTAIENLSNGLHVSTTCTCSSCKGVTTVRNLKQSVIYRAEMLVRDLAELKAERRAAIVRSCDA